MAKKIRRSINDIFDDLDNLANGSNRRRLEEQIKEEAAAASPSSSQVRPDDDDEVDGVAEEEHGKLGNHNNNRKRLREDETDPAASSTPTSAQRYGRASATPKSAASSCRVVKNSSPSPSSLSPFPATTSSWSDDNAFLSPNTSVPIFQSSELDLLHRQDEEAADLAEYDAQRAASSVEGFLDFLQHCRGYRRGGTTTTTGNGRSVHKKSPAAAAEEEEADQNELHNGIPFFRLLRKMGRLRRVVEALLSRPHNNIMIGVPTASTARKLSLLTLLDHMLQEPALAHDIATVPIVFQRLVALLDSTEEGQEQDEQQQRPKGDAEKGTRSLLASRVSSVSSPKSSGSSASVVVGKGSGSFASLVSALAHKQQQSSPVTSTVTAAADLDKKCLVETSALAAPGDGPLQLQQNISSSSVVQRSLKLLTKLLSLSAPSSSFSESLLAAASTESSLLEEVQEEEAVVVCRRLQVDDSDGADTATVQQFLAAGGVAAVRGLLLRSRRDAVDSSRIRAHEVNEECNTTTALCYGLLEVLTSQPAFYTLFAPAATGDEVHRELRTLSDTLASEIPSHPTSTAAAGGAAASFCMEVALRVLLNLSSGHAKWVVSSSASDSTLQRVVSWCATTLSSSSSAEHGSHSSPSTPLLDDAVDDEEDMDRRVLAACLLMNYLLKGTNVAVARVLQSSPQPGFDNNHHHLQTFLDTVARSMVAHYKHPHPAHTVFAGYCALLLGSLSLLPPLISSSTSSSSSTSIAVAPNSDLMRRDDCFDEDDDTSLSALLQPRTPPASRNHEDDDGGDGSRGVDPRVAVLTAVDRALRQQPHQQRPSTNNSNTQLLLADGTSSLPQDPESDSPPPTTIRHSDSMKQRPMLFVIALVQEFMLFQHATGVLTKQMVHSIQDQVERLMVANRITLEDC